MACQPYSQQFVTLEQIFAVYPRADHRITIRKVVMAVFVDFGELWEKRINVLESTFCASTLRKERDSFLYWKELTDELLSVIDKGDDYKLLSRKHALIMQATEFDLYELRFLLPAVNKEIRKQLDQLKKNSALLEKEDEKFSEHLRDLAAAWQQKLDFLNTPRSKYDCISISSIQSMDVYLQKLKEMIVSLNQHLSSSQNSK